jgi:hypothetical protein
MSDTTATTVDPVTRWRTITALVVVGWVLSLLALGAWHVSGTRDASESARTNEHVIEETLNYCLTTSAGLDSEACDVFFAAYDSAP